MLRNLLLFLFITTSLSVMAQHERDVSEARPEGGIEALVDLYLQIRFSETQQRSLLGGCFDGVLYLASRR